MTIPAIPPSSSHKVRLSAATYQEIRGKLHTAETAGTLLKTAAKAAATSPDYTPHLLAAGMMADKLLEALRRRTTAEPALPDAFADELRRKSEGAKPAEEAIAAAALARLLEAGAVEIKEPDVRDSAHALAPSLAKLADEHKKPAFVKVGVAGILLEVEPGPEGTRTDRAHRAVERYLTLAQPLSATLSKASQAVLAHASAVNAQADGPRGSDAMASLAAAPEPQLIENMRATRNHADIRSFTEHLFARELADVVKRDPSLDGDMQIGRAKASTHDFIMTARSHRGMTSETFDVWLSANKATAEKHEVALGAKNAALEEFRTLRVGLGEHGRLRDAMLKALRTAAESDNLPMSEHHLKSADAVARRVAANVERIPAPDAHDTPHAQSVFINDLRSVARNLGDLARDASALFGSALELQAQTLLRGGAKRFTDPLTSFDTTVIAQQLQHASKANNAPMFVLVQEGIIHMDRDLPEKAAERHAQAPRPHKVLFGALDAVNARLRSLEESAR